MFIYVYVVKHPKLYVINTGSLCDNNAKGVEQQQKRREQYPKFKAGNAWDPLTVLQTFDEWNTLQNAQNGQNEIF